MTRTTAIFFLFALLFLVIFALRREEAPSPLTRTQMLMGTVVEIRVLDDGAGRYRQAVSAAFAEMLRIEKLMSPHLPESDISRISAATKPVEVSAETLEVLQTALLVAAASDGAFDAGLGRLIRLWGFAEGEPALPSADAITLALEGVGPNSLKIEADKIHKLFPRLAVDLGGVAKGYAIDRAIDILAAAGIKHATVNAGGDMRLLGDRSGSLWRIGIQHPRQPGQILASLNLADRAVVTSGDYERTFEQEGVRYHHILDPRSGYPAAGCQSVTVVARKAAYADAMATAVFVLGPERGLFLLQNSPRAEGMIVAADGSVKVSTGLQEVIVWP